jgi:hypothetical protein
LCPKYGIIIESFRDKNMGEAKRRKALDPNYGKTDLVDILKNRQSSIFDDQILSDYLRYRIKAGSFFDSQRKDLQLQENKNGEIAQSFKLASKVLSCGQDVLLPDIDKYMNQLDENLKSEFSVFINYVLGTSGGLPIIKWLRTHLKKSITGGDLATLFPYLYMAAIKPAIGSTNYGRD